MDGFDIVDILRAGIEAKMGGESYRPIPEKEQAKRLQNFIERKIDFKVGDRVVRNEDGENRYAIPKKDQIALVISVFDKPMMDEKAISLHGEIGVLMRRPNTEDNVVVVFTVDFRYYKGGHMLFSDVCITYLECQTPGKKTGERIAGL